MDFPPLGLHQCVRQQERRVGGMMRAGRIRLANPEDATYRDRLAALPRIGKQMRAAFDIETEERNEKRRMEPP